MSPAGRCAVITGAGRGIGLAIARVLGSKGMSLALNDIDPSTAESAAASLQAAGCNAIACPGDVTKAAEVDTLFERVERELGTIWLLVNNAGAFHSAPFEAFPEEAWDHAFAVDVKAAFLCPQAAVRRIPRQQGGRIVVISSIAGDIVRTGQIAYSSAKAAAIHFSRCLAVELAPRAITVNCICPGMTDSSMLRQTASERGIRVEDYLATIPDGRLANPEDHAHAVAWLASDEAAHITGQVISIDGGQSLYHPLTLNTRSGV